VARSLAIGIAIAALIDPAVAWRRAARPDLVVIPADGTRDSSRAAKVAQELASSFTILRAPFANASGAVIVGDRPPSLSEGLPSPAFAVSASDAASLRIETLDVPANASLGGSVAVGARVHVIRARNRTLDAELRAGPIVVQRESVLVATDNEQVPLALSYAPPSGGAATLRLTARLRDSDASASADAVVDVRDAPWRILFFAPRPSWSSTFVRRALERDSRFVVTSRIATSRGVSTISVAAPATLADSSAADDYDAIVIGAPDALGERDVRGLERFARRRGGSVVLLLDRAPSPEASEAWTRLLPPLAWRSITVSTPLAIASRVSRPSNVSKLSNAASADSAVLRAADLAWPVSVPSLATAIASVAPSPLTGGDSRPIVWRTPLGAGALIVSGALDAWKSRDPSQSQFDLFWPATIAGAAEATLPALAMDVAQPSLAPGTRTTITITAFDSSFFANTPGDGAAPPIAIIMPTGSASGVVARADTVRLWPGETANTLVGRLRAPTEPGTYRVRTTIGRVSADAPIAVDAGSAPAEPAEGDLLAAWATARGGRVLKDDERRSLGPVLRDAIHAPSRATIWHPFRSAWWIVPFALALAGEWWSRRRAGLA
jgi:hypothetical protein